MLSECLKLDHKRQRPDIFSHWVQKNQTNELSLATGVQQYHFFAKTHTLRFPVVTCSKLKLCYSAHLQATKVEILSLCLVLTVGFSISFMRTILRYKHQNWSMNQLGRPIHTGGQNRCKVAFADSIHVSVFHHLMSSGASRSISGCFLKSLWEEAVPAVHTYLYEFQNSEAFWSVPFSHTSNFPLLHKKGYRLSKFEWLKSKETVTRKVTALAALHNWPQWTSYAMQEYNIE